MTVPPQYLSRTSAEHFEDRPVPCAEKKRSHSCTNVTEPAAMVNRPHPMQLVATPAKLTARAALHLEACSNAVAPAIIANPIALDQF